MTADAVVGLSIVAVVGLAMVVGMRQTKVGADRLAETRAAVWAAEVALAKLQAGTPAGEGVRVEPLDGGDAPAGYAWVRVHAAHNTRPASLVGLVPRDAAAAASTRPAAPTTREGVER